MKKEISAKEIKIVQGLSRAEQETTVVIARDEDTAKIYSSDNTMLTILKRRALACPTEWKVAVYLSNGEPTGYEFTCPKRLITFRTKTKSKKENENNGEI